MDILAHGLWAGAVYKVANRFRAERNKKPLNVWLAAMWGVFPDFFSFAAAFVWIGASLLLGTMHFSDLRAHEMEPAGQDTLFIFKLTSFLYTVSHSALVAILVFGLVWLVFRRPVWELGGWLVHILIDIPSHSYQFYPTPFLWPISGWKFNGISWSTPWFLITNYSVLAVIYLTFCILKRKRRRAKQQEN